MPSALEIRIILYAILGLSFIGGIAWGTHTLDAHHYERIAQADKLAQDEALQQAQRNVIAAQAAQKAAETRADETHAQLVQADTASRAAFLSSVRGLESALHLGGLSTAVGNPSSIQGTTTEPAGDPRIAGLIDRLNASIEKAIGACQHDSSNYAAILELVPQANK